MNGKCVAIKYAREHKVPLLGICLGMQCCVIEFARNVLGWKDANSTEFDEKTAHPVIDLMDEQKNVTVTATNSTTTANSARNSKRPV